MLNNLSYIKENLKVKILHKLAIRLIMTCFELLLKQFLKVNGKMSVEHPLGHVLIEMHWKPFYSYICEIWNGFKSHLPQLTLVNSEFTRFFFFLKHSICSFFTRKTDLQFSECLTSIRIRGIVRIDWWAVWILNL